MAVANGTLNKACAVENVDRNERKWSSIVRKVMNPIVKFEFMFSRIKSATKHLEGEILKAVTSTESESDIQNDSINRIGTMDPSKLGPFTVKCFVSKFINKATRNHLVAHVVYPKSKHGLLPVIIIAHGFKVPPSQYYSYAIKLASFGYIAIIIHYKTSFLGNDNLAQAKDLSSALDWITHSDRPELKNRVQSTNHGIMGHSLGGKLALLTATIDKRFRAVFCLDPVDGMGIVVKNELHKLKNIPTAFLGELIDSQGTVQACAPANVNYETFYEAASSPTFKITIHGANHFSFLDDVDRLKILRRVCKSATVSAQSVRELSQTVMVAFFQKYLFNLNDYDRWIVGTRMQKEYVAAGRATVTHK